MYPNPMPPTRTSHDHPWILAVEPDKPAPLADATMVSMEVHVLGALRLRVKEP